VNVVSASPRARARLSPVSLAVAAVLSIAAWLATEWLLGRPTHPRYAEMLIAARSMQAASRVLVTEKEMRGIMAPRDADPNQTGMIGPELTPITTTLGDLTSKRTTTNPDFSAALVRLIASLELPHGTPVVIVVSGSFVGGNVAAIAAVEALGLRPIVVASLSASMYGASDPQFNWLDMAAALRERGVIRARTVVAVFGGGGAVGGGMDPAGLAALRASAARDSVPMLEIRPFAALVDALRTHIDAAIGDAAKPGAVVNVGGALIGLGSCRESYELRPGLSLRPLPCTGGTPGLAIRFSEDGVPVLHALNMRRLATELGLPIDPIPLPMPGNNTAVYGSGRGNPG
jgi:poly-gamma-glutamate system protein